MQGTVVRVAAVGDGRGRRRRGRRARVDEDGARRRGGRRRRGRRGPRRRGRRGEGGRPAGRARPGGRRGLDADRRPVAARRARRPSGPTWPRSRARHAVGLDDARPEAVARRRKTGHRTARENVDDLLDPGSLVEYGPVVIAAQRRRRAARRPDRQHPGRRPRRRRGHGGRPPDGGAVLRLHGPGRHPGAPEPPQEGPPVRGGRAPAPARGVLHRGRRRAAGRHRRHRRVGLDCMAFTCSRG